MGIIGNGTKPPPIIRAVLWNHNYCSQKIRERFWYISHHSSKSNNINESTPKITRFFISYFMRTESSWEFEITKTKGSIVLIFCFPKNLWFGLFQKLKEPAILWLKFLKTGTGTYLNKIKCLYMTGPNDCQDTIAV